MITPINNQRGIGMVEVMIALILLAVAVLGFTAMQMTAVKATDESIVRTRSLAVMRGGAEMMRINANSIKTFKNALNGNTTSVGGITKDSCMTTTSNVPSPCTADELATRDALALKDYASKNDLSIAVVTCPGTEGTILVNGASQSQKTQERQCMIASWGDTKPTIGTDDKVDCVKPTTGIYNVGAQCMLMEAY